mmetsp:Transcript_25343/g.79069  ORF Transcript_25343/g.79069 Transcript_25343/m.79069 type:complete len:243 (+) Transcript_25343:799-1527(+)
MPARPTPALRCGASFFGSAFFAAFSSSMIRATMSKAAAAAPSAHSLLQKRVGSQSPSTSSSAPMTHSWQRTPFGLTYSQRFFSTTAGASSGASNELLPRARPPPQTMPASSGCSSSSLDSSPSESSSPRGACIASSSRRRLRRPRVWSFSDRSDRSVSSSKPSSSTFSRRNSISSSGEAKTMVYTFWYSSCGGARLADRGSGFPRVWISRRDARNECRALDTVASVEPAARSAACGYVRAPR